MVKALKAATQAGPSFCSRMVSRSTRWHERAGDVHQRLAGADPAAFGIAQVDLELVPRSAAIAFSQSMARRGAEITGRRMKTA